LIEIIDLFLSNPLHKYAIDASSKLLFDRFSLDILLLFDMILENTFQNWVEIPS